MASVLDRLEVHGLLGRVVFDDKLRALLGGLDITTSEVQGDVETGTCHLGPVAANPLGVFDLHLAVPSPEVPFRLELDGGTPPTGFHLYLLLSETPPAKSVFSFLDRPGYALDGAGLRQEGDKQWLEPSGEPVELRGVGVSLLVRGSAGAAAESLITPSQGGPDGIVHLEVHPPTVLVAGSGFGLELPDGLTLDSSPTAAAPGTTVVAGTVLQDHPEPWQGVIARRVRLFLPKDVPLVGGHPIDTFLAIGDEPPGVDLAVATRIPAEGSRPEITVRIECRDPTARGVAGLLPTLVEGSMTLPIDGHQDSFAGHSIRFLAGDPVVARASFARDVTATPPVTRVTLGVESQGELGILTIDASNGGVGERAAIAAGALVTALIADEKVTTSPSPDGDVTGVYLHLLLAAASALSAFLRQEGKVVLHGVELEGEGVGPAITDTLRLRLDYSVAAVVDTFTVGALSVGMNEDQPLRVRVRDVVLTIDTRASGLEMFHLGYDRASVELEDPGSWKVNSPGSLFDVLGTRSGRGSMWIEVDLRFMLDLGPVKVEGATIRATVNQAGRISAELRGLAAHLTVPGVIDGGGHVAMNEDGVVAALDVDVLPLNVGADVFVQVEPPLVALGLGIDLPGPIPLANSGLGIYGLGGAFAANGEPKLPPADTLINSQLAWSYRRHGFDVAPGNMTIGVEAVLGTVPDLGFSFSAKGGLFLTVPDVAIRVGLAAKLMSPRLKIDYDPLAPSAGFKLVGVIAIEPDDGVTIGVTGTYDLRPLLLVNVPVGAHFPAKTDDWFIYVGADGYDKQERKGGPIQATLLPGIIDAGGSAYLMMRGHGIEHFGRGATPVTLTDGFVLAFGFGFEYLLGAPGVIWAEVHASADILVATNPLLLAGFGAIGGSLNLGPVSLGVDATVEFMAQDGHDPYLFAQVCGHVDLFFTDLEGCVEIEVGGKRQTTVPLPNEHPLDRKEGDQVIANVGLIDETYRAVAPLADDPAGAETVWPDTLVHLAFATPPLIDASVGGDQFPSICSTYGARARQVGSEMLSYDWTLTKLELLDVTGDEHGDGTLVPGELSAAWMPGKTGDAGSAAEPAELVLLTPNGDLWLHRTADGGKGLGHDPLHELGHSCELETPAAVGWTHGWNAEPIGAGRRRLVPARLSVDPTASRLRGEGITGCSLLPAHLDAHSARLLPLGLAHDPARIVLFPGDLMFPAPAGEEGPFSGYLALDAIYVAAPPGGEYELTVSWTAQLEDPIADGRIWLVTDRRGGVQVGDELGATWQRDAEEPFDDEHVLTRLHAPHGDEVAAVTIKWRRDRRAGFVGLGGVTHAASAAAEARRQARAAVASRLSAAKSNGPQQPGQAPSAAFPSVLEPERTYRLDLDLRWTGALTLRDDKGAETKTAGAGTQYQPAGEQPRDCARSYWFRTPKAQPASAPVPKFGTEARLRFLKTKRDAFHPAMLERHLVGYEPAQTETCRLRGDPLLAHFGAAHVATLAAAYGFTLTLGLRQTDAPGPEELALDARLIAMLAPSLLDKLGRRWWEMAQESPCDLPVPGASLTATAGLEPQAWYELYVLAKGGDDIEDGRLPGVTFQTSRWAHGGELIDALGFLRAGAGRPTGDLEVRSAAALSPRVVDGDDAAFDAALAGIGHEGLPPAAAPRTSVLWQRGADDAWLLAGVLIESPEPIHRPGRLEFSRLGFASGGAAESPFVVFDQRRIDRSGSRILALTSRAAPIGVADPRLVLHLDDKRHSNPRVGRLELSPAPRFAAEP